MADHVITILQPPGTRLCGQCCLAMLAGISFNDAVALIGHRHSTRTKEMVKAFRTLGYKCGDRLQSRRNRPLIKMKRALVKVSYPNTSSSHWVAVINGEVHDPALNTLSYGRATSFITITKPAGKPEG